MQLPSTYHSRLYRDFKAIEPNAYRDIIRFYEEREAQILELEFGECFDMMISYANALFEIGNYRGYLLMVDPVVESSVRYNISTYRGEDIYRLLLFRKAAALYHNLETEKAEYILRELVHIDPYDRDCILFIKKCYRTRQNAIKRNSRALCVFLLLSAALVAGVEVLVIRPFFQHLTPVVERTRYLLMASGLLILGAGELLLMWKAHRYTWAMVHRLREKRGTNCC